MWSIWIVGMSFSRALHCGHAPKICMGGWLHAYGPTGIIIHNLGISIVLVWDGPVHSYQFISVCMQPCELLSKGLKHYISLLTLPCIATSVTTCCCCGYFRMGWFGWMRAQVDLDRAEFIHGAWVFIFQYMNWMNWHHLLCQTLECSLVYFGPWWSIQTCGQCSN